MHVICMRATLNTDQKNKHYILGLQIHFTVLSIPGDTNIQFNVTGRGVSVAHNPNLP